MIKNAFYNMLKAFFVLKIITVLPWVFGYVEKKAWQEKAVIFKIFAVTDWTTNN